MYVMLVLSGPPSRFDGGKGKNIAVSQGRHTLNLLESKSLAVFTSVAFLSPTGYAQGAL